MVADEGKRSRLHEVRTFCAHTTSHGLGRVAAANSWTARLFWLSIFICALISSVYHIVLCVGSYLEYPTKTDITLEQKEKLNFPAFTVCNLNPVKLSRIINTPLWHNITKAENEDGDFDLTRLKGRFLATVISTYKKDSWTVGHQGEDLIINCQFPGPNRKLPCSYKNFSRWFDMEYGNCYTINTTGLFVEHPGHKEGFQLTLFIDTEEYLSHIADSVGVILSVHWPYRKSNNIESTVYVAPGSAISVSLHAENLSRMDYPYNKKQHCNHNTSYNQMVTNFHVLHICLRECVAEKMRKDCGCVSVALQEKPVCDASNETQVDCVSRSRQSVTYDNCTCDPSCREMHFFPTVSSSAWPSKTYMPILLKLLNKTGSSRAAKVVKDLESARNNMAQVNIHFATMTVKNIKQSEAITWASLLGDVGGQLGLFIGVSCITLVEFLSLLWRLIQPTRKRENEIEDVNPTVDITERGAEEKE